MIIYVTHCSAKKTKVQNAVKPDRLYNSRRIKSFMRRCKEQNVSWAIFSDLYGVWFPSVRHRWYEKSPDTVTQAEFVVLLKNFNKRLRPYQEIVFYFHPARFHRLYKKLLRRTALKSRIRMITSIKAINGA